MRISKLSSVWGILLIFSGVTLQAQTSPATVALETIGGASGAMLYNSYTTLGILADAYAADAYDVDFTLELIDEQISIYSNMKTQFTSLLESGFLTDENDQIFTRDIILALGLLGDEANALREYVEYYEEESGDLFQERRQAAWEKIAFLLGIE